MSFGNAIYCYVKRGILFLMIVFITSGTADAQTLQDSVKVRELDEVIVSASKDRVSIISPVPMQSLTGERLQSLSSFSVADAIRYFSGVQLKDYGGVGGLKTVNVRSLGSAHTSVFYDGMHVGNAQNGQVDLGKYSLDNLEEIQLFNGQKSTIFQPARGFFSSSTLFLKSKIPVFEDNEYFHGRFSFKAGSFGVVNPALSWQQKLPGNMTLTTNFEYLNANGKYKYKYSNGVYDTTATRQNGDIEAFRAEAGLFAKVGVTGSATLKAYFYNSERGLPGAIVANRYSHHQRQKDQNIFIHGSFQHSFGENYELLFNAKYSYDYMNYKDPDYITLEGELNNSYYQNEYYASLVNLYSIASWCDISLAVDFSANTLAANLYRFSYPTRYSYLGVLSTDLHWDKLTIQASLLASYVDDHVKYYQLGDDRSIVKPAISLSLQPFNSESFRIRAFYKESFRMPTFNELYYTFAGNSMLAPEYTTQYDVGVTWIWNKKGIFDQLSFQGDVYYNKVNDKIVAIPSANLFRWTMMNIDEVEIKGIDISAGVGLDLFSILYMNVGLNYTYQDAIDITFGSMTHGDQIPYIPHHSGSATVALQWRAWHLNYSFIYTGERYSQKANIPVNYVPAWYTSDIAVGWQFRYKQKTIKINMEVNNLLDQHYDVIVNFPMPGISYRLSLAIEI
jgi:outer membrane cobalamin receptor